MSLFIDIGALDDIPRQGARLVRTARGGVAVFRTADDQVFALDDRYAQNGGPLSEGIVHGHAVTCPLYNRAFDLATGQAADGTTVAVWPIRAEAGRLLIGASQLIRRAAA